MATPQGLGIPFRLPPESCRAEGDEEMPFSAGSSSNGDGDRPEGDDPSATGSEASSSSSPSVPGAAAGDGDSSAAGTPSVRTTRTRTVKSRAIFTPEDDSVKKPRGRGGKRGKRGPRKNALQALLADEEEHNLAAEAASFDSIGDGLRKRSRNASDGENRWDRIRAKVKLLLLKIRRDTHFLQVYQQDGWKSSGREKLKPTAELVKARARVEAVKGELREVAKRLTDMNSGGARWGSLKQDKEGNIEVAEVVCTKCNKGDSDDADDILLCDYAGCFRAYHQNCLTPAIKAGAFPGEQEDWFCWQCECLTDCLEMIERELQAGKIESAEDVFPDMEAGVNGGGGAAGDALLTDTDDSDDESFKGSSSESDEDIAAGRSAGRKRGRSGSGSGSGSSDCDGEGSSDSDEDSVDDDTRWMSDAESVGSDEVAKLHDEAGDLDREDRDQDFPEDALTAGGSRGSRAFSRRRKRHVALGLPGEEGDDRRQRRVIAAALKGDGKLDRANILTGRTRRRRSVDYVKLNEAVFGNESVDGDQPSSDDAREPLSSEASGSDASDASSIARPKKYTPKPRSRATIDPLTGLKRKRGRPRKVVEGVSHPGVVAGGIAVQSGVIKRKPGRPRKSESVLHAVANNSGGSCAGISAPDGVVKRKPGRPRKIRPVPENGPERQVENCIMNGASNGTPNGGNEVPKQPKRRGRPPKVARPIDAEKNEQAKSSKRAVISGAATVGGGKPRSNHRPPSAIRHTAVVANKRPASIATGPGGSERASIKLSPLTSSASSTSSHGPSVAARGSTTADAIDLGAGDDADAIRRAQVVAMPVVPIIAKKRGRGRPRKHPVVSKSAGNGGVGDDVVRGKPLGSVVGWSVATAAVAGGRVDTVASSHTGSVNGRRDSSKSAADKPHVGPGADEGAKSEDYIRDKGANGAVDPQADDRRMLETSVGQKVATRKGKGSLPKRYSNGSA